MLYITTTYYNLQAYGEKYYALVLVESADTISIIFGFATWLHVMDAVPLMAHLSITTPASR